MRDLVQVAKSAIFAFESRARQPSDVNDSNTSANTGDSEDRSLRASHSVEDGYISNSRLTYGDSNRNLDSNRNSKIEGNSEYPSSRAIADRELSASIIISDASSCSSTIAAANIDRSRNSSEIVLDNLAFPVSHICQSTFHDQHASIIRDSMVMKPAMSFKEQSSAVSYVVVNFKTVSDRL